MVNKERVVNSFLDMVKISSLSLNERAMADYLKKELTAMGLEVEEDNVGEKIGGNAGNIIAVLKAPGKKKILFSAHMDTVCPCEKINPIVENGIIKTDGTSILGADDKAGIAAIIEMIKMIQETKIDHPEIIMVFSVAEEIGLLGAQYFDIEKYKPDYAFIIDSGGKAGSAVVKTPYAAKGDIKIIGKTAHAGVAPELGINALMVASHAISKIKMGRIDSETTSNIGIVKGGNAVNIVMPEVVLTYEARSIKGEKLNDLLSETFNIFQKEADKYGAKFEHTVVKGYDGYNLKDEDEILKIFSKACEKIGVKYNPVASGGGCDANIYSGKGIVSMNMGIGMSKVHSTEEYIEIEEIIKCTKLIYEISKGI